MWMHHPQRKRGTLLLALCMLLVLNGCGSDFPADVEDKEPSASAEQTTTVVKKQQPATTSPAPETIEALDYTITPQDHSVIDSDGNCAIHVVYDLIEVSGAPGAAQINQSITGSYENLFLPSLPKLEAYVDAPGSGNLYDYFMGNVTYNAHGVFSANLHYEYNFGGVNVYGTCPYNFDINTGNALHLRDVLPNVDEATIVDTAKKCLIDYAQTHRMEYEGVVSDIYARFADTYTTSDTLPFYIAENGECVLCFDKYALTYGAAGEFIVPMGLYIAK